MDDGPDWRWNAFTSGLSACGFIVARKPQFHAEDVIVTWNRSNWRDRVADNLILAGGRVIVAENGYIGKDSGGRPFYALARDHHNGAGRWFVGQESRWNEFGIKIRPWRDNGDHILILPQRGIGAPGVSMPKNWLADVQKRISRVTKRPIRVRPHPGLARVSMSEDMKDCWAAVTWASGAGIKAIVRGVPVFHEFDRWIGRSAAKFGIDDIETPFCGDRAPMLHSLSWAQFSVDEIATGEPFRQLLNLEY